jgi:hypothetical protein
MPVHLFVVKALEFSSSVHADTVLLSVWKPRPRCDLSHRTGRGLTLLQGKNFELGYPKAWYGFKNPRCEAFDSDLQPLILASLVWSSTKDNRVSK